MAEKEKGFLKRAADAFSSKDEKETINELEKELAKTKREAEASKKAIKSLLDQRADPKEVEASEKKVAELEAKISRMEQEREMEERKEMFAKRREEAAANRKPAIITTHTVESNNQTLSHIALKYYNHATPPYWQYLLEHNKEVLNGSEKNVRMGMELEIPELPEDLKD